MDADKQKEVLRQMLDTGFAGGDSLTALREKLGIDGETWEAWLREGGMPGDLVSLSKAMAEMCAPWVWASLLELTRDGSVPAMKLYFELCKEKNTAAGTDNTGEREILALRQEIFGGSVPGGMPDSVSGSIPGNMPGSVSGNMPGSMTDGDTSPGGTGCAGGLTAERTGERG